ncbi:hypothetical protein BAE44_0011060 [Dichanthelium oligosanthes]|uniref:DUF7771 domain-containing protein n=1 Tax=Dichanthelium oligosanthes TaxID=888268 RepID=A0A1E5VS21_9POAL|nr:hypothetical protein BAE44_0011060 [Dichanthelium oligosanthes]
MNQTSQSGLNRWSRATVLVAVAAAILDPLLVAGDQRRPHAQASLKPRRLDAAANDSPKDCFITDKNGRKWPCSRRNDPAANITVFYCRIENHLGAEMYVDCDNYIMPYFVDPGKTLYQRYISVFDPAPRPDFNVGPTGPKVTCEWGCDGNRMTGMVVWDEQWPEAWSCRKDGGDGNCQLVFESNREVVLVTTAGRRVLGDVAIKECRKNWWGYGGWLPFGLGCTYPKHAHSYYGEVKS